MFAFMNKQFWSDLKVQNTGQCLCKWIHLALDVPCTKNAIHFTNVDEIRKLIQPKGMYSIHGSLYFPDKGDDTDFLL